MRLEALVLMTPTLTQQGLWGDGRGQADGEADHPTASRRSTVFHQSLKSPRKD